MTPLPITPGPWSVEDPFDFELSVVANGDKGPGEWTFVAGCNCPDEDDHDITFAEVQANAKAIAAVPAMIAALRATRDELVRLRDRYGAAHSEVMIAKAAAALKLAGIEP